MKNTDEALGKLIEKGIEVAEKSGQFVIDQAPDLLKEFYQWHIAENIFSILIGIIILFGAYKVVKLLGVEEEDYDTDLKLFGKHIGFGTILTSAFMTLFGGIFICVGIYQLVFILVAPKLYLIEYFIK